MQRAACRVPKLAPPHAAVGKAVSGRITRNRTIPGIIIAVTIAMM
jgi:hypothetical protein